MPRDPRKLRVFGVADELVPKIYAATKGFPSEEKFGMLSRPKADPLQQVCGQIAASLAALVESLEHAEDQAAESRKIKSSRAEPSPGQSAESKAQSPKPKA